jgi:hypothetical protein
MKPLEMSASTIPLTLSADSACSPPAPPIRFRRGLPDQTTPTRSFPCAAVHLALVGPYVHTAVDGDAGPWMGPSGVGFLFLPGDERGELIGQSTA